MPVFVGKQNNNAYALYYKFGKQKTLKIILDIKKQCANVITLMIVDKKTIPRMKYD